jgi:diguanylate cyclase (GGDEF)-like protein
VATLPKDLARSARIAFVKIMPILLASRHDSFIESQRAALILSRSRHIAALFAVLTPAWSIIDAISLPLQTWALLALARIVVAGTFLRIATLRVKATNIRTANRVLAVLYAVPIAFFLFANLLIGQDGILENSIGIATVYYYSPFIMAAAIALFPLTIIESGLLLLQLLLGTAIIKLASTALANLFPPISTLWELILIGAVGSLSAISQLHFYIATVEQATRDPLTGLVTRGVGTELLHSHIETARRKSAPLTAIFIDLDHFKDVNDKYGHEQGDKILATAAKQLRTVFRKQDILTRWGGEEFLVVCPGTNENQAISALERLTEISLGRRPDGSLQTASIGVAEWGPVSSTPSAGALVELADQRMYLAKQAGRNRIAASNGKLSGFLPLELRYPTDVSKDLVAA